jgi:nucleoside-diphosphate-sugar epimerase
MTRIAVVGGSSYVAQQLVAYCAAHHPDVRLALFGRTQMKLNMFARSGNVIGTRQYSFGAGWDESLDGYSACIDLSYNIEGIPSHAVGLARHHARELGAACAKADLPLVAVGSVAVYGEPTIHYKWRQPPLPRRLKRPNSTYARVKAITEETYADVSDSSGLRVALMRSGHIMGPGSKMATNVAARLLSGEPLRLHGEIAASNATTVDGLCRSFVRVSKGGLPPGVTVSNHVDLADVTYDQLIDALAGFMDVDPISANAPARASRGPAAKVAGQIKRHQQYLGLAQSYMPWTENLAQRMRPRLQSAKSGTGGSPGRLAPPGLASLYASDRIPHTTAVLGSGVSSTDLVQALTPVAAWLNVSGFIR